MSADETLAEGAQGAAVHAITVTNGNVTAEELAALVAVLGSLGGAPHRPPAPTSRGWAAPASVLGATGPGPGAWRASTHPR